MMLAVERGGTLPHYHTEAPFIPQQILTRNTLKGDNYSIALKVEIAKKRRFVEVNGNKCEKAQQLLRNAPQLVEEPLLLAKAVNFLAQGDLFKVIDNPEAFRREYDDKIKNEEDINLCGGLSAYGRFRTEEVALPLIKDNTLTFYAVNGKGVPHCITCPLEGTKPISFNTLRSSF